MKRAPKPSGRAAAAASVESVTNQTAATSPLTQSGASSRGPGNYLTIPPRNAPRTPDPEPCNSPNYTPAGRRLTFLCALSVSMRSFSVWFRSSSLAPSRNISDQASAAESSTSIAIGCDKGTAIVPAVMNQADSSHRCQPLPASCARSQALALAHSLSTVRRASPIASAVSSAESPAK